MSEIAIAGSGPEHRSDNMLKKIVYEALHGVKTTVDSFNRNHPGERAIFASATTFSEFKGQRIGIARRGVVIITGQRVFFKSVLLSLYSLGYLLGALLCLWLFFVSRNLICLIAGIVVGAMIAQRLPLQRQLLLTDVDRAALEPVKRGLLGGKEWHRLRVVSDDWTVFFFLSQPLPDEVAQKLGIVEQSDGLI
jgi:hypothetical protein